MRARESQDRKNGGNGGRGTLAQIAQACGVSAMTVSRALRENTSIAEDTRKRIRRVAEEMGYHPNVKRGRPRRQRRESRPAVDVIVSTAHSSVTLFYAQLLVSIEQELARRGHDCVIRTCNSRYDDFLSICETMRQADTCGTLAIGHFDVERVRTLLDIDSHTVLVDHVGDVFLAGSALAQDENIHIDGGHPPHHVIQLFYGGAFTHVKGLSSRGPTHPAGVCRR